MRVCERDRERKCDVVKHSEIKIKMVVRCAWVVERGAIGAREEWTLPDCKLYISLRLIDLRSGEAEASKKTKLLCVDPSLLRGDPTAARLSLSHVLSAKRIPTTPDLIRDIISFSDRMTTLPCSMCGATTAPPMSICDCCGRIPIISVWIALVTLVNSEEEGVNVHCTGNHRYSVAHLDEFGSNQLVRLEKVKIEEEDGSSSADTQQCSICLEQFGEGVEEVTKFPCSHLFHSLCIHQWLDRKLHCPLCRFQLPYRLCGRAELQTY